MKKQSNNNSKTQANNKGTGTRKPRAAQNRARHEDKFSNDPSWYSVDPVIMRDAATLPYSIPAGSPLPLGQGYIADGGARVPGVLAIELAPTVGTVSNGADPINIAATQSYAYIRHANSGSANYDAPDIMLYFLAMADIYSYIEYLKRMYGVAQVYAQRNRYLPGTLLRAMKVEPDSLINNLANFRMGVNMLINKVASFAVPSTMSLFLRRQFLYAGVYTEGNSIRDQLYLFVPNGFHAYNWKEGKTDYFHMDHDLISSELGITEWTQTYMYPNYDLFHAMDLIKIGHHLIDRIINNEDMGIMNGDILKAYGDNILKLSYLAEDYAVAPVFDPYVLEQIQNATILPMRSATVWDIQSTYINGTDSQVDGMAILKSTPKLLGECKKITSTTYKDGTTIADNIRELAKMGHHMGHIITTQLTDPTDKDNMEITRLSAVIRNTVTQTGGEVGDIMCGTEVCVGMYVYSKPYAEGKDTVRSDVLQIGIDPSSANSIVWNEEIGDMAWVDSIATQALDSILDTTTLQAFKYRPTLYLFDLPKLVVNDWKYQKSEPSTSPSLVVGQLSNYTVISAETMEKLHLAAIMNEFATPHVAIKQ